MYINTQQKGIDHKADTLYGLSVYTLQFSFQECLWVDDLVHIWADERLLLFGGFSALIFQTLQSFSKLFMHELVGNFHCLTTHENK